MLQRPYTLDDFRLDDSVPTWSSDGDGMVVIKELTAENTQLHSRIPDGEVRPVGYVVVNEMDPLAITAVGFCCWVGLMLLVLYSWS